ncbi:MAG: XTP/dITP diphosphatase [Deltaproteobacteria bacterium]|nr:XTP/dITP diphosphatase [Deltaproteobacteria bacterium]
MKIVLASKNQGKINELKSMLRDCDVEILSLEDFPDIPDIEEDGKSFFENALIKARTVSRITGETVLADDSGLEVDALGGAPGIYSSRYAGSDATDEKNIRKLLAELQGVGAENRAAAFRCVLVLFRFDGTFETFEGRWPGRIIFEPRGEKGFGYDPIFEDPQLGFTAAELAPDVKNVTSHRGRALHLLKKRLLECNK